ncbi:hypothetical protein BOTBODRAFT_167409 [Botryobasidium botryosum FD-172 SS1]|uniref:Translation initiation factor eIF2B subunit beta n=1 Tax=Botryobasidium botryosum (strain FD-172 SS1) TaxID=930990 RepID=A0A067LUP5_BOTB1|nr:hypothetical protein BOTBODRAFT_167409 [Botryobasidium botryosum FD-172 SS1]
MPTDTKDRATQRQFEALVSKLRRRQLVGAHATAMQTVLLLRQVVSVHRMANIQELVHTVKSVGRELVAAQPKEHSVGNIVRKVLRLIREEHSASNTIGGSGTATPLPASAPLTPLDRSFSAHPPPSGPLSLGNFVLLGHQRHQPHARAEKHAHGSEDKTFITLKPVLIQAIQEVIDELETVYENVAKNARDHIHTDEIILTIGKSRTVEAFLKSAARDRRFTAIVAETAPSYSGREMAKSLAASGITTVLVPDSSIYALMTRVNKVILGAHAVLANGGMFAVAGSLMAATAAQAHATPVIVCTAQYKLTPLWNLYHEYGALDFSDPAAVLGLGQDAIADSVDVLNPYYDYVKPDLIDVLVTNYGDHSPSYVYRLVNETYDDADLEL